MQGIVKILNRKVAEDTKKANTRSCLVYFIQNILDWLLSSVGSTDRCNTCIKTFCRCWTSAVETWQTKS